MNFFNLACERRRRERLALEKQQADLKDAVTLALTMLGQLTDLLFKRDELESQNPDLARATQSERTTGWISLLWVSAVFIIDVTLLKATIEYIVDNLIGQRSFAGATAIYVIPAAVATLDVGIGQQLGERRGRTRRIGWLALALPWSLLMPCLAAATYLAASGVPSELAFKLQLLGLAILAFCSHASLLFAPVHRGLTILGFIWRQWRVDVAIAARRDEYIAAVTTAQAMHQAYWQAVSRHNAQYPDDRLSAPAFPKVLTIPQSTSDPQNQSVDDAESPSVA